MMQARAFSVLTFAALVGCHGGEQPTPSSGPAAPAVSTSPTPSSLPGTPTAATDATTTETPPSATSAATANGPWTFEDDSEGSSPAAFSFGRTGSGATGRWVIRTEADAPSPPNVLAQLDTDATDYRFPVAIARAPSLRDVRLSVRCKPVSGRVDQACGLVFRYQDDNNYFVARANALENNVRLYHVKDGKRRQIASWSGKVIAGKWHDYAVEARGDHIQVFWDGNKVLDHNDATFPDAGRVGVWTKADSVTYFDDLRAEAL